MSVSVALPALLAIGPKLRVVPGGGERAGIPEADATLVERIRSGHRGAEEDLYRKHAPRVLALTTRLLGGRADAEDATQDTFVLALENIDRLRDPAALVPWLLQIAVSQARRRFRRRRLLAALGMYAGADDATLDSLASPSASPEVRADLASLDRVLAALPADQRIAWMLRHVEGEELETVARMCGCSLATVKRRIASADTQVRAEVRLGDGSP
jgi:RNA polymerase sigma-70 factor (ECF subfamily)